MGLPRIRSLAKKQDAMIVVGQSAILLRFCVIIGLLSYFFAGACLALPAEPHCARCAKLGAPGSVKLGAFCPLSSHGHHCHHGQSKVSGKTPGKITLCSDGCLHHNDQGGEIPSLAKFVAAPETGFSEKFLVTLTPASRQIFPEDPFNTPPYRPPILPA